MELKHGIAILGRWTNEGSNRTFMELKQQQEHQESAKEREF